MTTHLSASVGVQGSKNRKISDQPLFRLKKRADFLLAADKGQKWVTPAFVVQVRDRTKAPETATEITIRVGFTASRKVGNAVARNRTKRRLRAIAAGVLPQTLKTGYDIVLIARGEALTRPFLQLRADLLWALKRLDVRRDLPAKVPLSGEDAPCSEP
jgi:ribonuclease P protein component